MHLLFAVPSSRAFAVAREWCYWPCSKRPNPKARRGVTSIVHARGSDGDSIRRLAPNFQADVSPVRPELPVMDLE